MPGSGCLSAVTGQAAQSILRCSLINLLMRLYALAAHETKEETFMIHAALQPQSSKDKELLELSTDFCYFGHHKQSSIALVPS